MFPIFWSEFGLLFAASLIGGVAILPYSMRLLEGSVQKKPLKMSVSKIKILAFVQTAVLFAFASGVGLLAAHAIGLGAPYIEAALGGNVSAQPMWPTLGIAIILGVVAGAALLIADLLFLPYWPAPLLETTRKITVWENFAASFYGGINEEILIRLFGLSAPLWLISKIWHTSAGLPTAAAFWVVNIVMTILFGLGHLPALKNLLGRISPLMLARSLLLNAPVGLLCGWLFWTYGIEMAIVAHFCVDIVYHVFGTVVLRRRLAARA